MFCYENWQTAVAEWNPLVHNDDIFELIEARFDSSCIIIRVNCIMSTFRNDTSALLLCDLVICYC